MSNKLTPCPFCGSEVELRSGEANLEQVHCPSCGASNLWDTRARENWNKRTRKETRLKPCPICGQRGKIINDTRDSVFYVRCYECGLMTIASREVEEVIEAWNRRPE